MPRPRALHERIRDRLEPEEEKAAKKKQSAAQYYRDFVAQLTPKQRDGLMEALYEVMGKDEDEDEGQEEA